MQSCLHSACRCQDNTRVSPPTPRRYWFEEYKHVAESSPQQIRWSIPVRAGFAKMYRDWLFWEITKPLLKYKGILSWCCKLQNCKIANWLCECNRGWGARQVMRDKLTVDFADYKNKTKTRIPSSLYFKRRHYAQFQGCFFKNFGLLQ